MTKAITDSIPQQLYTPEQVREIEPQAAQLAGVSMWQLMRRAGHAVFSCLQSHFPLQNQRFQPRVTVLCGSGNNGGDGYVLATLASLAGYPVRVFASKAPTSDDAKRAQHDWHQQGGRTENIDDWADADADVVIDALLGTGLNEPVRDTLASIIEGLNESGLPVIAIDLPSGLHADTGAVLGVAVRAQHTVTMVAAKRGLFTGQASDYCGHCWFADLGILREFRTLADAKAWRLELQQLHHAIPPRPSTSHKGMFGHVVVVGGSEGMAGAARLAGEAALRAGAGKVSVICQPGQQALVGLTPELMVRGLDVSDTASDDLLAAADIVAIGPGLGREQWGRSWWHKLLDYDGPLVVDADALNLLALAPTQRDDWVLTPHPGEAAGLLGWSTSDIATNRWQAAETLMEQFGGVVVLKGAGSIIQGQDYTAVNTTGNAGLASAGMGDALTGIIAAFLAPLYVTPMHAAHSMRQSLAETVGYAVLAHGAAGDRAAGQAPRGMLASDLINAIRNEVNPYDDKP